MLTNFFYTAEKINLIKRYSLSRVIGINTVSILALFILRRRDAIEVRFIAIAGVELVLLLFFYQPYVRGMIRTGDRRLMLRCLKLALPVMLSSLFGIVINFGDKFFLERHFNYKVLSVYYLACSCASAISLLSISLQNVWLPLFFKEKDLEKNFAKTNRMVLRLVWILAILSILIMTVVICALQWNIIPKAYQDIVFLLPLQLAGQIVIFLALLYSNYLIYFEKTSLILWSGLLVSTISTLLNMTLIPIFGAYGAATTLLVSNGSYLLIYYNIIAYYRKRHLLSKLTA
jgi:O-antigen/teichoic acid export membrane protein